MKANYIIIGFSAILLTLIACGNLNKKAMLDSENSTAERLSDHKLTIYQLLVRHFGNKNNLNKFYGSLAENGSGKFNDINDKALEEIKKLGISHVWYTGVIEHATMTDYSTYGIHPDDPDVVKGRAGSPYAIKDYYDVDPDLAVDVDRRIEEFEELIVRTHQYGLKVLMDFIPNHVARTYASDKKPDGVVDIGAEDDTTKAFSARNDFYYVPNEAFQVPAGYNPGGDDFKSTLKDGHFEEFPAKATGNDVFSANPSIDDWFETIKLNYGVDYLQGRQLHIDPIPPLWEKMRDILLYWAEKGTDGFRCDMAEMVPVEFWEWVIPQVKEKYPALIFIAEIYNPQAYRTYIEQGHFDYLYDKVGLYDGLRKLVEDDSTGHVDSITHVWKYESNGFSKHMLRFLENHDEQRIASRFFAGNAWFAKAAMVVSATLSSGPVMIYSGQEVGEPAIGAMGFSGDDGRTTIFDYWGVPHHQRWMNGGAFDGGQLNDDERGLRRFYADLLQIVTDHEAIREGDFFELLNGNTWSTGFNGKTYAFLRYTEKERLLIVANFERRDKEVKVYLPDEVLAHFNLDKRTALELTDLLSGKQYKTVQIQDGILLEMISTDALILSF
ncbi:alpha-amylase family glycosyl hydrolase [Olivibacter sitiensis]|uniref:alpha-amylase family glycosyl hydrolase n=1 Tax=Olivibacter sitiensis TaxID=376470 RepID=UPI000402B702|nr:alpha-amylase family glycosyl hydrolase [Olivibacter sitiensis]